MLQQLAQSAENQYRAERKAVGWSMRLMTFSIIVFFSSAILYAAMTYGYGPVLDSRIKSVNGQIEELKKSIKPEDRRDLLVFYSQVYHIQDLLKNRNISTKLLAFLGQTVEAKTFFTGATFDGETGALGLQGTAATFEDLTKQLEAFRKRPEISSLVLSDSRPEQADQVGKVNFTMRIIFVKNFLKP